MIGTQSIRIFLAPLLGDFSDFLACGRRYLLPRKGGHRHSRWRKKKADSIPDRKEVVLDRVLYRDKEIRIRFEEWRDVDGSDEGRLHLNECQS
ncbi:Uncharacterized protein APZ42_032675 [Daphnia magna]|uniref:Uncharacterized protein n=1 Tax=Daphnia magna TaxID=35525 RepID=A0A0P6A8I6_9CRUS|nr:Uncharacterized protein APZ42_032675 [Daphnia magna]